MPTIRFPYVQAVASDPTSLMPRVPVTLRLGTTNVDALGLVDSGATVNVLPYELGVQLGASWDDHTIRLSLSGNLARAEARAIRLKAKVGSFEPVDLLFA